MLGRAKTSAPPLASPVPSSMINLSRLHTLVAGDAHHQRIAIVPYRLSSLLVGVHQHTHSSQSWSIYNPLVGADHQQKSYYCYLWLHHGVAQSFLHRLAWSG
ncbi:hypothetical protein H112_06116 [Trichophyton rubrum D6]|uniref:Uncharacterized protein n=3 Tax=Trichophyton TaxID=5550 RepID=A0A080WT55_TRIRC|nr:uncharacterized protein TERG_12057 [Trichophyton rubrum CBS 118892]EZF14294.1 hypothetical protein H100_06131 [Trichophyton rubrum MR850]EZF39784.1 hypothetical protein H102_06099 [Trichophyton rubrum CBS 100081]EZF50413.1 hypothetical protein H103_06124 [Trichophyton rubrum CBS 288.86]EZF61005.1 hypothetical protein H104_06111 [Trichophyton rubrum CBS 289.86]EZF71679.1 hypothetical protein H105_06136 [Trichophyton soudanense CBS 452.61]EZF82475.1 hypothetical protein H110_06119 [Trichophy